MVYLETINTNSASRKMKKEAILCIVEIFTRKTHAARKGIEKHKTQLFSTVKKRSCGKIITVLGTCFYLV